ncbi:hypothetical protein GCM10010988_40660 [Cnuibacter physcomitrellae]|uniref:Uncharacterized protein n=1 Tax=Cnuibacter physcomitrellae TaxID=1619308 RepID=A0A1X9LWE6_9MICO|nr:copper resistance CopC family protein [Cnuibacter physcomitrellae]ARJ07619.1 hypothetical protein B5808_19770 [Cnuibacter physcomitrellae]GGI42762.1 hypothetical protein GCM10010988_40660 [Cnuibacter physcomitrellae]
MTARPRHRIPLLLAGIFAAAILGLSSAPPASAHDALASATPAPDATVTEPLNSVELTFNESPLAGFETGMAIVVLDPAGTDVSAGTLRIADTQLSKDVAPSGPGQYQVLWQTVSSDGHPISGQYAFTYTVDAAPAPPVQTPTPTTPTPTPEASAPTEPAPSPDATPLASDAYDATFPIFLVASALVIAAILAVAIILGVRARRRKDASREGNAP